MSETGIDIRRRARGVFRVRLGAVAFDVTSHPQPGGGVHLDKPYGVFVAPDTWRSVCDQIKGMTRFDRTEGQHG